MISSMTGFGQACAEVDGIVYHVEIRAVNNRYFKANLRLPDIVAFLESDIERLERSQIYRGTVNYSLKMKNVSGQALFDIDENTLKFYIKRLEELAADVCSDRCNIEVSSLMSLPGIVQPLVPDTEHLMKMKEVVLRLTDEAVEQLKQSRLDEGKTLAEDMVLNCNIIREKLKLIGQRSSVVVMEYRDRLFRRTADILADIKLAIDSDQIAREVALFAERCDISEEVTRLGSHVDQFEKCCGDANVGRRMDFISQEMLREANTIASKSSDSQIAQWVIDIKCSIDRIKEQVQNVE